MAALDMYMEKGQWQKCIDTAEQQVSVTQTLMLRSVVHPYHCSSGQLIAWSLHSSGRSGHVMVMTVACQQLDISQN